MELAIKTVDDLSRVSKMFVESGFFQDTKDAAQAGVKILAGQEKGFAPFSSMTGFHIIQGRPAMGANLIAAGIKRSGKYDYRVITLTDDLCELQFFENTPQGKEAIGISTFNTKDAQKAQVKNMQKFPRNMLFARAISNGVRFYCPDVFDAPVYTPEELGANVDEEGNVLEPLQAATVFEERDYSDEEAQQLIDAESPALMNKAQANAFHAELGVLSPNTDHKALATHVLKRDIESFTEIALSEKEAIIKMIEAANKREAWRVWRNDDDALTWAAQTAGSALKAGEHVTLLDDLKELKLKKAETYKNYFDDIKALTVVDKAA